MIRPDGNRPSDPDLESTGKSRRFRGGANAAAGGGALLLILGVIATVALIGRGGSPQIVESAEALSLDAWGY